MPRARRATSCTARRCTPPFPDGIEHADLRRWAASGAPSGSSGRLPGVYTTAVGYAGGFTPNPTYEEVCSRHDRPHRGRAGRLRPGGDLYEELLRRSGRTTTRPRACARATTSAPSTARRSTDHATEQRTAADASRDAFAASGCARAGYGEITTEIARPARSTTPRTTTSSTSRRTRAATAASAGRASPARSASASAPPSAQGTVPRGTVPDLPAIQVDPVWLLDDVAAVDDEGLAGHVGGLVRGQEDCTGGRFGGGAGPADGCAPGRHELVV